MGKCDYKTCEKAGRFTFGEVEGPTSLFCTFHMRVFLTYVVSCLQEDAKPKLKDTVFAPIHKDERGH
jgi:hypothetical protein